MKRKLLLQVIPSIAIATILLIAYYFLSLKPKGQVDRVLDEAKSTISIQKANLLQNRLSITAMVNLNPATRSFNDERSTLLQTAVSTNDKGLEDLDSFKPPNRFAAVDSKEAEFVNGQLIPQLTKLKESNRKILEEQKEVLDDLISFDQALDDLFRYAPFTDLGQLDTQQNKEELINRSANAINGLKAVLNNINESENDLQQRYPGTETELNTLKDLINQEIQLLNEFSGQLSGNDFIGAKETTIQIVSMHDMVKLKSLEAELSIIRSPVMVELLTDQTNLMLEYDFLINRIDSF